MKQPNPQEKLNELKELRSYERYKLIEKEGWDKMPGQEEAPYKGRLLSQACTDGLELLMEK